MSDIAWIMLGLGVIFWIVGMAATAITDNQDILVIVWLALVIMAIGITLLVDESGLLPPLNLMRMSGIVIAISGILGFFSSAAELYWIGDVKDDDGLHILVPVIMLVVGIGFVSFSF